MHMSAPCSSHFRNEAIPIAGLRSQLPGIRTGQSSRAFGNEAIDSIGMVIAACTMALPIVQPGAPVRSPNRRQIR